jgi:hypothetical protein
MPATLNLGVTLHSFTAEAGKLHPVHGRSLGAELGAMLDEVMWQGIEAGYRRLAASQAEMKAYQAEAAEWVSADIPDLAATAADEYPEYNS